MSGSTPNERDRPQAEQPRGQPRLARIAAANPEGIPHGPPDGFVDDADLDEVDDRDTPSSAPRGAATSHIRCGRRSSSRLFGHAGTSITADVYG